MFVIAIILILIGTINFFISSDKLMALSFIITGLLILSNRALYIPSRKVVLGAFVTGASLSSHVDSYIYEILGDSFYDYGFFEYLNIIWSSIFTSYPVGYEDFYVSRRVFLIALVVTTIFTIVDLVKVVALTPVKNTKETYSTKSSPIATEQVNEDEDFYDNLTKLEHAHTVLKQGKQGKEIQYYNAQTQYFEAQNAIAFYCAQKLYLGKESTVVREFANSKSRQYPWIERVDYDQVKDVYCYDWSADTLWRGILKEREWYANYKREQYKLYGQD